MVTPERKNFVRKFAKNSAENEVGQVKKVWGDILEGGDRDIRVTAKK